MTRKVLDALGVSSYCKTSGSTGLHIYVPLGRKYTYETSKEFGVSMPLHWAEVKKGLKISDFTLYNAVKRISKIGDIFIPVIKKGIDFKKVMKALDNW